MAGEKVGPWFLFDKLLRDFFQYSMNNIEAINNRTKHTADIANKLSMGILGSSNKAEIGPFFRKAVAAMKSVVFINKK